MTDAPHNAMPQLSDTDLSTVLHEYMQVTTKLQQTHEALQHEVVRLRQELASKDRELELRRRLAALGELAAGVAHEVRNPLGAIQLYSGLLRTQCRKHKLSDGVRMVEKIEAGIEAIEAVVQDTLALAPRDRQLELCPIRRIVDHVCDTARQTVETCGVELIVEVSDEALAVRADAKGLERVLVNLIVNAAEASPPQRRVWLRACESDENVELHVVDEGGGISEDILHRIFDPFFTTKQQGTGLGLTIAHRLIEAYGGQLHAGNRPSGGAQFVISLPSAAASSVTDDEGGDARKFSAA